MTFAASASDRSFAARLPTAPTTSIVAPFPAPLPESSWAAGAAVVLCDINRRSLLGHGGVEVLHEWVRIDRELGDHEGHPLSHQASNERNVSGEPIELRVNRPGNPGFYVV
jgi:hypothetical protein